MPAALTGPHSAGLGIKFYTGDMFPKQYKNVAFIARHGHRACGEVDMAIPRWAEKPDEPLGMLRHFVRSVEELDPLRALEERSRDRQRRPATCPSRSSTSCRRCSTC